MIEDDDVPSQIYATDEHNNITEEIGTVVSFAASMDLTFASGDEPDTYWSKLKEVWALYTEDSSPLYISRKFRTRIKRI